MQAAISGLQGIAILIDDSRLNLIDISNPNVVNACSSSFASNFLSRSVDCVFVDNVSIEAVTKQLESSWEGHAVIRLVSIINDATADDELRADAVEELNEIATASPEAVEFAERYLFSAPTQIELSEWSDKTPEAVCAILIRIQSVQPAITSVLQAIERSLASELQDSTGRATALATLIREGVVRRFVLAVNQSANIGNVLAFAYQLPAIGQSMRPILSRIQSNLKEIEPTLAGPELQIVSEHEDWEKDKRGERRKDKAPVHQKYAKSIANRDAIERELLAGRLANARNFVDEFVAYQLRDSGTQYAVKTLCDIAMRAQAVGQYEFQLELTQRATEVDPADGWSLIQHAHALKQNGRLQDALAQYLKACSISASPVARTGYAETLRSMGRFDEALIAYEETKRKHPTNAVAKNGYAETLRSMGRFEEALIAYEEAKHQHPNDVITESGYAETLRSMGRFDEALIAYQETKQQHPNDVITESGYAETLRSMGRFDEALIAYEETKRQHPSDITPKNGYAETLRSMGRFDEAIIAYEEIKRQHRSDIYAKNGYAETLRSMGRFDEAIIAYEETKRQHPNDIYAKTGYAETLRSMGRFDEALIAYVQTKQQHPHEIYAKNGYAETLRSMGRFDEALEVYAQTMSQHRNDRVARSGYYSVLVGLKRFDEVVQNLADLKPSVPDDWIDFHILGMSYLRIGEVEKARNIFVSGLSQCGVAASIPYFRTALAITLLRAKNSEAAVETIVNGSITRPVETLVASHATACIGDIDRSRELLDGLPKILSFPQRAVRDEINAQYITKTGAQHDFEWLIDQHILLLLAA